MYQSWLFFCGGKLQVALSVSVSVSVSLPTHLGPPAPLPPFRDPHSSARILRRQLRQPQQPGCLFNTV